MKPMFVKNLLSKLTLAEDEVRIIAVRPTANELKVQLVFVEAIEREGQGTNLVNSIFNKSDEAFGSRSLQPYWYTVMISDAVEQFPQLKEPIEKCQKENDYVEVNIVNPTVQGHKLCIQITETHRAREADVDRGLENSAKQDGNGNFLTKDGLLIFSRGAITIKSDRKHTFIKHDGMVKSPDEADFDMVGYEAERTSDKDGDTAKDPNVVDTVEDENLVEA